MAFDFRFSTFNFRLLTTNQFIEQHRQDDVNVLALNRSRYPEVDIDFALQQIEGWQRARHKLPQIAMQRDWIYPPKLSMEQCSSETTAENKRLFISSAYCNKGSFYDLTGGAGIDFYYLQSLFKEAHYVEQQEHLCEIARNNFGRLENVIVEQTTAETKLDEIKYADCIYLDPARRDKTGGKVFRIEDCTPDISSLYERLISKCDCLMIKLSPMLDITEALKILNKTTTIEIVASKGEMKELLFVWEKHRYEHPIVQQREPAILVKNINSGQTPVIYYPSEEKQAESRFCTSLGQYLYEPNAALMKAGAFKMLASRWGIDKLEQNTHLFTSNELEYNFPGRILKIIGDAEKRTIKGKAMSVISRNYPLSAEQIRQKYKLKESDTEFLVATHFQGKNLLLMAEKVSDEALCEAYRKEQENEE